MKKLIIILLLCAGMATTSITTAQPVDELQGAEAPEICTEGLKVQETYTAPATEKAEQVTVKLDNPEVSTVSEASEPIQTVNSQVRYYEEIPLSAELQQALFAACDEFSIDYALALGLIQTESNFNPYAVNRWSGCYGLCQLHPACFPSGLSPEQNIHYGIEYLARQIRVYGSVPAGLTAYTVGHDDGSRSYANVVMAYAAQWENIV